MILLSQFKVRADMLCFEQRRRNRMGHFKEIEIGFVNIVFPIQGRTWPNYGRTKYKIYDIYIYKWYSKKIISPPYAHPPERQTKSWLRQFFLFLKRFLMTFNDFINKMKKVPCQGRTIETNNMFDELLRFLQRHIIKEITTSPPQAPFEK